MRLTASLIRERPVTTMVAGRFRIVVLADGELSVVSAAQFSYVVHIMTAPVVDVDKPVGHHQARSYIYNKV